MVMILEVKGEEGGGGRGGELRGVEETGFQMEEEEEMMVIQYIRKDEKIY